MIAAWIALFSLSASAAVVPLPSAIRTTTTSRRVRFWGISDHPEKLKNFLLKPGA